MISKKYVEYGVYLKFRGEECVAWLLRSWEKSKVGKHIKRKKEEERKKIIKKKESSIWYEGVEKYKKRVWSVHLLSRHV